MPLHPVSLGRDHTSLAYCCGWNMKCPWLLTLGTLWSLPSGATGRSGSLGWASRLDGPALLPASLRFHECVAVGPAGLLLRPSCPPCLLPCLAHHTHREPQAQTNPFSLTLPRQAVLPLETEKRLRLLPISILQAKMLCWWKRSVSSITLKD